MLSDRYSPAANSLGVLRLGLALAVLVGHAWPLGAGQQTPGLLFSRGQTDLGALAVDGFFVLSGFLVAGSGVRCSAGRFAWHRFLRIFPGLWVCLLTCAVAAGTATTVAGRNLKLSEISAYVVENWWGTGRQWGIGELFASTPYGRLVDGVSVVNGSLWSLTYELFWYCVLTALVACGIPRRAPRLVPLLTAGTYLVLLSDFAHQWPVAHPRPRGAFGPLPVFGALEVQPAVYLGFLFLLGACAQLYRHRVPLNTGLAVAAALVLLGTLRVGGFSVLGLPAYAYLLLWAACALPAGLHAVGRTRDYSFGVYLYAFPVQQLLASYGAGRWGVPPFAVLSALATALPAVLSWHLVERPALSLKSLDPLTALRRARSARSAPDCSAPVWSEGATRVL